MRVRMVAIGVGAGVVMSVVGVQGASAWGALAIDSNHGSRWGYSHGYGSQSAAMGRALAECGGGCTVVVTFDRTCGAYAVDRTAGSSVYGWGLGTSRGRAEQTALGYCRSHGGRNCSIRVWGCDNR